MQSRDGDASVPPFFGDLVCGTPPPNTGHTPDLPQTPRGQKAGNVGVWFVYKTSDNTPIACFVSFLPVHGMGNLCVTICFKLTFLVSTGKTELSSSCDSFSSFILRDHFHQIWTPFTWGALYYICDFMRAEHGVTITALSAPYTNFHLLRKYLKSHLFRPLLYLAVRKLRGHKAHA